MVQSIEGIFRNGKIELLEPAPSASEARVIITFLMPGAAVDLEQKGIDQAHAATLRAKLKAFEEDWNRPEMDLYDAL